MNRKHVSLLLSLLLIIMMITVTGCSVDTSTLGGLASLTSQDKTAIENSEVSASGTASEVQNPEDAQEELKYDETEFLSTIEPWNGQPYCEINGNIPDFEEIWATTQESLDPLDSLGRCGTANSCIGIDGMPTEPRGNISEIHPTGWHTDKYDFVTGGNLYNRCHLIAHKLSGDDAVARNLITGTSYMNRDGMLPFEDQIEEYVKSTHNHVMYRVTPCFAGDELVARGVHMQAISVEDQGQGLAFNVFCYNVQPGIEIDYTTGDNRLAEDDASQAAEQALNGLTQENVQSENGIASGETQDSSTSASKQAYVLNTNTGKFHHPDCRSVNQMKDKNKQEIEATRDEVIAMGYEPCGNCHP